MTVGKFYKGEDLLKDLISKFPALKDYQVKLDIVNGTWTAEIKCNYFNITGIPSGCGCMVLNQYSMISYNKVDQKLFTDVIKYIFELYISMGSNSNGTFITTLGINSLSNNFIEGLGFKEIAFYPNKRHGDKSPSQKLYILNL